MSKHGRADCLLNKRGVGARPEGHTCPLAAAHLSCLCGGLLTCPPSPLLCLLCLLCLQGIKVKDAETKRAVKQVLAAEEAMRELMMDTDEAPQEKVSFATGSGSGSKPKAGSSGGGGGGGSKVKTGSGGSRVKVRIGGGKKGKAKAAAAAGGGGSGEGMALD